MNKTEDLSSLVEEYQVLLERTDSEDSFRNALIGESEWSPQAATHLLQLAKDYGSFVLRNALATSLALEIEDGELGL